MTTLPQVRILHLSDLHFGKGHICGPHDRTAASRGIPLLKDLLAKDLQSPDWESSVWAIQTKDLPPTPLLIAATGDLTQAANPKEFQQANDLLRHLTGNRILGSQVDLRHVFVVPGNHDVVFTRPTAKARFAPYIQFYNNLFKDIQPEHRPYAPRDVPDILNQVHAFPENRFLVAEINSCYYVEKETLDESRGQVDLQAIATLRRDLEPYGQESRKWIKIALIHHHPVLLPSFVEPERGIDSVLNAKQLLRLLRENGFQLVLHGHKHFPQVFPYDPDSAWATAEAAVPQFVVAGGSCGSRSLPEGTEKRNTYNLITFKWNPEALEARVEVVTRGLTRTGQDDELDPDRWSWKTLRTFDKVLSPYESLPLPRVAQRRRFPRHADKLEDERDKQYQALRFNMPVVEVLPSLMPGQGYEARAWLVPHRHHRESPKRVVWSAGPMFDRKVLDQKAAPGFCVSFHYWGAMLIQVELEFADGQRACTYVYARLPDSTTRR